MTLSRKKFHITLMLNDQRLKPFYEMVIEQTLDENSLTEESVPFLSYTLNERVLSIKALVKSSPHTFKFFLDFLTRWFIPLERLNLEEAASRLKASSLFSVDFKCGELSHQIFNFSEVSLDLPRGVEEPFLQERFLALEEEIKLGLSSESEARRIMEIKGVTFEEKALFVQDELSWLIKRFPGTLSQDILQELSHMLVLSPDVFKGERTSRHLCRLVVYEHLFKRSLTGLTNQTKEWRVKIFRARGRGGAFVLGIFVGVNHLDGSEVFDEKHLFGAVEQYVQGIKLVEGSYFSSRRGRSPVATFYIEVEKKEPFSHQEITLLRRVLPDDLKGRVESLMQPLFMPSNEEELMRNTMILSNQIKFTRDVPQLIISFQEQKAKDLVFSVILVRVKGPENPPIEELSLKLSESLSCSLDRCKTIGFLRKKYTKEAASLSLYLPKDQFFRKDNSIDLYKARQVVVDECYKVLGEFRDYNGGMISKQNELLKAFKEELEEVDELFVDNFFFSLMPVVMRTVLDVVSLKALYQLVLEAISLAPYRKEKHQIVFKVEESQVFASVISDDSQLFEEIQRSFEAFDFQPTELAFVSVVVGGSHFAAFLYRIDDTIKQREFCLLLERSVEAKLSSSDLMTCEVQVI